MRNLLAAAVLGLAGWSAWAAAEKIEVDIYVKEQDTVTGAAKPLVSAIYNQIGVRLVWHTGEMPYQNDASRLAFAVRVAENAPDSATSEALASARIVRSKGAEIVVYQSRLERLIAGHGTIANVAAAYVLAHELAHVMQAVGRHSEAGIMKAYWNEADYHEMVFHRLAFTAADVDLIHHGLTTQSNPAGDAAGSF